MLQRNISGGRLLYQGRYRRSVPSTHRRRRADRQRLQSSRGTRDRAMTTKWQPFQALKEKDRGSMRSHRHLCADLDHAPGGNLEEVGGVAGRFRQADEQPILPAWHARAGRRFERSSREKERRRHDVELPALLARDGKRLRDIGRFHVAELQHHAIEVRRQRRDLHPLVVGDARRVGGDDGEDDVALVQHLVVLEIVQERGRRELRMAGQEHRRARHDMRRLLLEARKQRVERHLAALRLLREDVGAAAPGQDQQHHRGAEQDRRPGAFEQLEQVGREEHHVHDDERRDHGDDAPQRPMPELPDHDDGEQAVHHHGGGDRNPIGRRERTRGAEQPDQQQDADQQGAGDARDIDLPRLRRRGVENGQPRQQTEVDRLVDQRIGAGDHGLARDDRRSGREHHHGQQQGVRHQAIERVLDRGRIGQHLGALPEVIDQQRGQHETEPGDLDRLASEMAEVGIERLAAGDDEEYQPERDQADMAVGDQERHRMDRIDRRQHARIVANVQEPRRRDGDEPGHHDGREEARHPRGPAALRREQSEQDHDGQRHDIVLGAGGDELEPLDRREHRDRGRDDGITEEHRGPDDTQDEDQRRPPAERARRQRRERERAALPVVVGIEQQQHVLDRDHHNQRPQDEREHAQHRLAGDRSGLDRRRHCLAERIERAGADVAIDDADAAEREGPQARWGRQRVMSTWLGDRLAGRNRLYCLFAGHLGHQSGTWVKSGTWVTRAGSVSTRRGKEARLISPPGRGQHGPDDGTADARPSPFPRRAMDR